MALWQVTGQALTGSDPSFPTDGFDLEQVRPGSMVRLIVTAEGGNCTNIAMQCWMYDREFGLAARLPAFDFSATAVGKPSVAFLTPFVQVPKGKLCWVSVASTVSAGTTLKLTAHGL